MIKRDGYELVFIQRRIAPQAAETVERIIPEGTLFITDGSGQYLFIPKKPEWTGEGLPPVGAVCEVSSNDGAWSQARIKFIGDRYCVYQYVHQEDRSSDQLFEISMYLTVMRFRLIRTPEQIAADERKAEVNALTEIIGGMPYVRDHYLAERLYCAGYRKQVNP